MDVTLADGRTIPLSRGLAEAVLGASPLPDAPHVWSPVYLGAPGNAALIDLGLAERTRQGFLGLTPLGHEVRARLQDPRPERVTLDPGLSGDRKRALLVALADPGAGPGPRGRRWTAPRVVYAAAIAFLAVLLPSADPPLIAYIPVAAVLLAVITVSSHLADRERERRDPRRVLESLADHYVLQEQVEGEYRVLLERTRAAVDAVLESAPHREGLLLDTVRNRVVLAETEWTIARGLARLSGEAARADGTPIAGERSRAAAERARAALAEERGHLERRIGLLEEYAAGVRSFEAERADAASAREFDAITDRVLESGAAHGLHDEALASLVRAQELALRLSDLTGPERPRP
ncbi:hypothetical protein [Nocardiopsis sp. NPDC057823]|uniref:hypothetical protein n=1 Tax=Nocardiopsis sp. NPDC057823 TaxID=3346256 RepID=UPI00366C2132